LPIEKVDLPPRIETSVGEDGRPVEKVIPQWEVRATGKEVQELRGAFKDTAPQMMHDGMKEWEAGGGNLTITKPDGTTDVIRADKEQLYRSQNMGFCEHRVRPGIMVDGFGGMKRQGLSRFKVRYHEGQREVLEAR
jgi:hypothetical protein